jgi:hypothetical protein
MVMPEITGGAGRKIVLWALAAAGMAAMLMLSPIPRGISSADSSRPETPLAAYDAERIARQSQLKSELSSRERSTFMSALQVLSELDEEGALDVWKSAIGSPDPAFKQEAWALYRRAWPELSRKERVPEVVRFNAPKSDVIKVAGAAAVDAQVFSEDATGCTARMPQYSVERMRRAGLASTVLYASLSEMDRAARSGTSRAVRLASDYKTSIHIPAYQVRIAVIDLATKAKPAPGYSDWLGDQEDVVMRSGSLIAYLDVFASDGSTDAINAHIQQRYTRRGYTLKGFFTTAQFASSAPTFFPGKSFSAGRSPKTGLSPADSEPPTLNNGAFHSYFQAQAEFTALAQSNPNLAEMVTLGSTFQGNQVFALKIGSNASVDDPTKPNVLITGCHHAREWISVEPPIYYANQLIAGYSTDDGIKYLLDHVQIWIVPVLNPDGLTFSQGSPNDQLDPIRLWRKNMDPVNIAGCGSGVGVDLNRNYDFEWRLPGDLPCPSYNDDVGASDDILDDTFRGPAPDSELEVQDIGVLTDDPNHHFQVRLDYHNFDQLVLYPWGYQSGGAPDNTNLGALATQMAALARSSGGVVYTPEQAIDLYITTGDSTDYSYAVDSTPAPFTVELRPSCCDFNVPESDIGPINQENWPGALMLLNWSSGPPILQSVQAYQLGTGQSFSNPVYSAHWIATAGGRQLVIDTHSQILQSGPLQVQLQFSKPMDPTTPIAASLGQVAPFNQLTFAAIGSSEGWQKTVYSNDTWIGEVTLAAASQAPWTLAVSASDATPLKLDGNPASVAAYVAGSGGWQGYEDSLGSAGAGGTDTQNSIGGTVPPGDGPSIVVGGPTGALRLAGGDECTVTWTLPQALWFTVAQQQIWLSTDGGSSFSQLAGNIGASASSFSVTLPSAATTQARLKVVAGDADLVNVIQGLGASNFTIGQNVGKGLSVSLVSSQLLNQSWSYSPGPGQATESGASQLAITLNVTNAGSTAISNSFFQVDKLSKDNVLLSSDPTAGVSASVVQSINSGSGGTLSAGQSVQVRVIVGLVAEKNFTLSANVYGAPSGGSVAASHPITIWQGKPRTRSQ